MPRDDDHGVQALELANRLRIVERVMQEHGWSPAVLHRLADELGVNPRTVKKYRATVLRGLAEDLGEDPVAVRSDFLLRLRGFQRRAASSGRWGPVSSMMRIEADVLGIRESLRVNVTIGERPLEVLGDAGLERLLELETKRAAGESLSSEEETGLRLLLGDGERADVVDLGRLRSGDAAQVEPGDG